MKGVGLFYRAIIKHLSLNKLESEAVGRFALSILSYLVPILKSNIQRMLDFLLNLAAGAGHKLDLHLRRKAVSLLACEISLLMEE